METAEHPGKKIRFLLHTNSMTIQQLAESLGVTKDHMREIVDEEAVPTPHLLHRICGVFGVREDYFGSAIKYVVPEPKPGLGSAPLPPGIATSVVPVARRKRKLDLAELAARHQALVDCLVAKKVLLPKEYQKRLDALRSKIAERQKAH